jgi:hypothetical protein
VCAADARVMEDLIIVNIPLLSQCICALMAGGPIAAPEQHRLQRDFVALSCLFGNDFLCAIPGLEADAAGPGAILWGYRFVRSLRCMCL